MPSAFAHIRDALRIRRAPPASAAKPPDSFFVNFAVLSSDRHSRARSPVPLSESPFPAASTSGSAESTSTAHRSLKPLGSLQIDLLSSSATDDLESPLIPQHSEPALDPLPPDYDPVTDPQSIPRCRPLNSTHFQINSVPFATRDSWPTLASYCGYRSPPTQDHMIPLASNLSANDGLFGWPDMPSNFSSVNNTNSTLVPVIARPPTIDFGLLSGVPNATDDVFTFPTHIESGFFLQQPDDNYSWFASSTPARSSAEEQVLRWWALALIVFPLLTTFGNALVVYSVACERSLRTTTNFFVGT